jgi:uncharacterized membrane protein
MILIFKIFVALFASAGFMLALYIHRTKKNAAPLVCPLEGNCEQVVHSDYSKLIGIPVELLGLLYYAIIVILYFCFAFFPIILPAFASYAVLGLTITAFLFSVYLTAIQALVLKQWCTWCLFSAGICTIIFILAFLIANTKAADLLSSLI